ncbi:MULTISPECIES: V-type ATP synthase subunit E family protein [Niastella]|uniref:Cell wall anchor protein n=1 Tax=Niastella soli TaxID=2821487 RepID=A0ABS3YU53_9BACT|nr:hypothetical protein [Niastella soli]MBO9201452.1 hypothetical protein [Niastella soli]
MRKNHVLLAINLMAFVICSHSVLAQPIYQWNGNRWMSSSSSFTPFLEIMKSQTGALGPVLRLTNGAGMPGAQCAFEIATFDAGTNPANFRIVATDLGDYASRVEFQNKPRGVIGDPLQTRLTIADFGFVGIGTTNPASKLHVSEGNIAASTNDQLDGFVQMWGGNAVIWKYGSTSNGLRFGSANDLNAGGWSEKMRISDNGAVCIGTILNNPPDYKLFVELGIRTRKVKVDAVNPWPDYVFHSNYPLRPLSEVEQYVKQYGHLPEVPSAEEVNKEGIDLGNNQAALLKKIEELTLYVIEQNKKQEKQEILIQEQSKLLQAQQQKLEELENQVKGKH